MVIVNIQKFHFMPTYRTKQRIISKRSTNGGTPFVKAEKEMMFSLDMALCSFLSVSRCRA